MVVLERDDLRLSMLRRFAKAVGVGERMMEKVGDQLAFLVTNLGVKLPSSGK